MTLNHNYGCFSGVGSGIAGNVFGLCEYIRSKNTGHIAMTEEQFEAAKK